MWVLRPHQLRTTAVRKKETTQCVRIKTGIWAPNGLILKQLWSKSSISSNFTSKNLLPCEIWRGTGPDALPQDFDPVASDPGRHGGQREHGLPSLQERKNGLGRQQRYKPGKEEAGMRWR